MVKEKDVQKVSQFIDSLEREGFIDFEPYLGYNHCIDFGDIIDLALNSLIFDDDTDFDTLYLACLQDEDVLMSFEGLDDDIQELIEELNSTTKPSRQSYQRDFY